MASTEELYTTKQIAARTKLSESQLEKLRIYGGGPEYLKVGNRVLYRWCDVERWVEAGRRKSTSDTGASQQAA